MRAIAAALPFGRSRKVPCLTVIDEMTVRSRLHARRGPLDAGLTGQADPDERPDRRAHPSAS